MNLIELRKEKKLSQQNIAKILNVTQRTYSGYELEQTQPNIETLILLANYYDCSVDYLIGREKERNLITKNYQEKKQLLKISEQLNYNNFMKLLVYATALLDGQKG